MSIFLRSRTGLALFFAAIIFPGGVSNAGIIQTTDKTEFSSWGTISQSSDYSKLENHNNGYSDYYTYMGNPVNIDGITYTSISAPTPYRDSTNIIVWSWGVLSSFVQYDNLVGKLNSAVNMISFSTSSLNLSGSIIVNTNIGSYDINTVSYVAVKTTSFSEYITSFTVLGQDKMSGLRAVETGMISSVPGPIAGAGIPVVLGLFGFGLYRRKFAAVAK